jgi:hypothetical protein
MVRVAGRSRFPRTRCTCSEGTDVRHRGATRAATGRMDTGTESQEWNSSERTRRRMMTRPVLDAWARLLERGKVSAQPGDPKLIRNVGQDNQRANERQHEREPVLSAFSHGRPKTKNGATKNTEQFRKRPGKVARTIGLFLLEDQTSCVKTRILKMSRVRLTFTQETWNKKRKVC